MTEWKTEEHELTSLETRAMQLSKRRGKIVEVQNAFYELPLFVTQELETDEDGAEDGTTLKCSALSELTDYNGFRCYIMQKGSKYCNEERAIDQDTTDGTVHVSSAFSGQILDGTRFWIVGMKTNAAGPHESDKGIDMRLFNYMTIFFNNDNMDKDVAIQLKGNRIKSLSGNIDIGSSFTISASSYNAKSYNEASGLLPYLYISITFAAAPTEAIFFAYALMKTL